MDHVGKKGQAELADASRLLFAMHKGMTLEESADGSNEEYEFHQEESEVSIEKHNTFTAEQISSASVLTRSIHALFDDMVNRNGVLFKQVLHERIEESRSLQTLQKSDLAE